MTGGGTPGGVGGLVGGAGGAGGLMGGAGGPGGVTGGSGRVGGITGGGFGGGVSLTGGLIRKVCISVILQTGLSPFSGMVGQHLAYATHTQTPVHIDG